MATGIAGTTARELGFQAVHYYKKTVNFNDLANRVNRWKEALLDIPSNHRHGQVLRIVYFRKKPSVRNLRAG